MRTSPQQQQDPPIPDPLSRLLDALRSSSSLRGALRAQLAFAANYGHVRALATEAIRELDLLALDAGDPGKLAAGLLGLYEAFLAGATPDAPPATPPASGPVANTPRPKTQSPPLGAGGKPDFH
jgi:hypothetical protein